MSEARLFDKLFECNLFVLILGVKIFASIIFQFNIIILSEVHRCVAMVT